MVRNRRGALDRRTILGKMVLETVRQLETDLGGDLSTAERVLVANVALDTLLLQALNNEVADSSPIIEGKDGLKAHPVYQLRAQLVAQRRETLKLLGIKRVSKTLTVTECSTARTKQQQPRTLRACKMSSTESRTYARTALTHVQNDFERCANPFCDKQREIKPRGQHGRYCSDQCRTDGYALRRAKALLNKVGIIRFHELLDQAQERQCRYSFR